MLKPAKQKRIAEDIAHQLEQAIIDRRLNPRDKIQTEREMQETFQASRGAVREALGILRQKGLIETRRGMQGGAFVKAVGVEHASEGLAFLIKYRQVAFQELAEFREAVESLAASLAVERVTPEDIEQFNLLLKEMAACLEEIEVRRLEFYKFERKMHESLARLSGNSIIEWVLKTIHMNLDAYAELATLDETGPQDIFEDWCEIIKAIRAGQGVKVNSLIRSHIVKSNKSLKQGAKRLGLQPEDIGKILFAKGNK